MRGVSDSDSEDSWGASCSYSFQPYGVLSSSFLGRLALWAEDEAVPVATEPFIVSVELDRLTGRSAADLAFFAGRHGLAPPIGATSPNTFIQTGPVSFGGGGAGLRPGVPGAELPAFPTSGTGGGGLAITAGLGGSFAGGARAGGGALAGGA